MPHINRPMPLPPSVLESDPKDIKIWAADITTWIQRFALELVASNKLTDEEIGEEYRRMGFIE